MLDILTPIAIIAILIVVNGFFVAAEFAVAGASRPRVAQLAESGSASAQHVLQVLASPIEINRYLSTAQVGITLASLGLGMYGEHAIAVWLVAPLEHFVGIGEAGAHTLAAVISVALLTYLHVVLGEMIPKSLALQSAATTAVALSTSMRIAERIFRPLTLVLNAIGNTLLRWIGLPISAAETRLISTTELTYIFEESSEGGLLEPSEQIYLENVIDFNQRAVGQIMTPRNRMAALDVHADLATTIALICEERHSRYPVFNEDRDDILGILHVKELARYLRTPAETFDLQRIIRPAVFVPESLSLDEMLGQFRTNHFQVAIVVDEYGGTAGLVTLEDLAEEIIGEIQDEFDEEMPPFTELDATTLRVRGDLLLDELRQHFDLNFEEEEAETVGGLIMSALGQVAESGQEVEVEGVRFAVEAVEGLAVQTALVYLPVRTNEDDEASPRNAPADTAPDERAAG
jgi:CBS domain containing-hemolysin-like protein